MHGVGGPNGPGRRPAGVPAAGFVSGADHREWPTVCLSREVEEIGSTDLAGSGFFILAVLDKESL
jgi:hypothetical protein